MTPESFAAQFNVSRETMDRLAAFDAFLIERAAQQNLISRSTIDDRWARHYADSAQLFALIPPAARTLADLGSGAGFPGLVLAAMGAERDADNDAGDGLCVTLIESRNKKADFLRDAAAKMALTNVEVIPQRIESTTISPPHAVTARALAQLHKLLGYIHGIADEKTVCILPKGQDVEYELTEATKYWHMDVTKTGSLTSPGSTILTITNLAPRDRAARRAT